MNDQTKSNHTPTPWKAVDIHSTERNKRGVVYYQIKQANGAKSSVGFAGVYDGKNPKADADFIIEAVNNHAELKARIAELEKFILQVADVSSYSVVEIDHLKNKALRVLKGGAS